MKHINGDTQMTDVWRLPAIAPWEKSCGKHPTKKPLDIGEFDILKAQRKGSNRYIPFICKIDNITIGSNDQGLK